MRYGDEGEVAPGVVDVIEPGAFGSIEDLDVVLNVQHTRGRALARTQGSGLTFDDSLATLSAKAVFAETTEGTDTLTNIRTGILRGFSLEYTVDPKHAQITERADGKMQFNISKATITGLAIVDTPAYPDSKIIRAALHGGQSKMDENKLLDRISEMIDQKLREAATKKSDNRMSYQEVAEDIMKMVKSAITKAFKMKEEAEEDSEMQKAKAQKAKEEADRRIAEAKTEADRKIAKAEEDRDRMVREAEQKADKAEDERQAAIDKAEQTEIEREAAVTRATTAEDTLKEERTAAKEAADKAQEDMESEIEKRALVRASERAQLLVMASSLIPEDTDTTEMSDKEILVLAAGDEVSNAENRHVEYLRAKVEDIVERRGERTAARGLPPAPARQGAPVAAGDHSPSVLSLIAAKKARG